jgi:hypothetical protein
MCQIASNFPSIWVLPPFSLALITHKLIRHSHTASSMENLADRLGRVWHFRHLAKSDLLTNHQACHYVQ